VTLTGGYDAVIQMSDAALTTLCARLHGEGRLSHRHTRVHGGEIFDFVFGPPRMQTVATQADGRARFRARTTAFVRARPMHDPAAIGRCASADISFSARLDAPTAGAAQLAATTALRIDVSDTIEADIAVTTSDAGFVPDVKAAVLEMAKMETIGSIPIGTFAEVGVRAVTARTVTQPGPAACLTLALRFGTSPSAASPLDVSVRSDWSIALSRGFAIQRLVEVLRPAFGGSMPPPYGPSAVLLAQGTACLLETPVGCLVSAHQRLYLRRLELDLAPGRVILRGTLSVVTDGPFGFEIDANWSTDVTVRVDSAGVLEVRTRAAAVQLSGVLAAFANFLSSGRLESVIRNALVSTIDAQFGASGPLSWLDGLIGAFGDSTAGGGLKHSEVDVRPDGIVLHGFLSVGRPQLAPVPVMTALASSDDPLRLVLGAAGSWSPGGDIARIEWRPGDGTSIVSHDAQCCFAAAHVYSSPGRYDVALEVRDAVGRVARVDQSVEVGILRLHLDRAVSSTPSAWHVCATPGSTAMLDVVVTSSATRLRGITVTLRGNGWSRSAVTDARGVAHILVDVDQVTQAAVAGGTRPPLFSLGGLDVEVEATGCTGAQARVWLVDCAARAALRDEARNLRDQWLRRWAGYPALRRIRDEGRPGVRPPAQSSPLRQLMEPFGSSTVSAPGSVVDAAELGAAVSILDQLTMLVLATPDHALAHELLGTKRDEDPRAVLERLNALWTNVDQHIQQFERSYGLPEGKASRASPSRMSTPD
jgi:hypothetical protein